MSDLVKLAPGALAVGQALPWTVYDHTGSLLVRRGYVIHSERQLERFYERGMYFPEKVVNLDEPALPEPALAQQRINPFNAYSTLAEDMAATLDAILNRDNNVEDRVFDVARRLDTLCTSDPDACLALVHNSSSEPSAYEQTLFHAILCRLVAARLELDGPRAISLLAAALTANISLLRHLDKLNSSSKELSDAQRAIIRRHPLLSSAALTQAGFTDRMILQTVEQHHEQFDGSGYPNGCQGKEIILEARIMALAERYTAMISVRGYRKRTRADRAMADILGSSAADPDKSVYHALIKELTLYPPGVIVRLSNAELAIVTHRPIAGEAPLVQAIVSPKGNPYRSAVFRDCDEHRIEGIVMPDTLPSLKMNELWGYV